MGKDPGKAIERLCPEIDEAVRKDFLSRMDQAYFASYAPDQIAGHLRMIQRLNPDHPVELMIHSLPGRMFEILIISYDYFGEFSIFCGLLASFRLNILSGDIYTFSKARVPPSSGPRPRPGSPWSARRKIVDLFRVQPVEGLEFQKKQQDAFRREIQALIRLLERSRFQEARERVNRQLFESLSGIQEPLKGLQYPVEVRFDNRESDNWTVIEIKSRDVPSFLYAFTNALALRGIYIHGVRIENLGPEVRDRLYVSDRQGRKIEDKQDQDILRVTVVMIKQFTYFLAAAPDPAKAILYFDQLLDKALEHGTRSRSISLLRKQATLTALARLLGTSDFLWEDFLRIQFDNLLPVLQDFKKTGKEAGRRPLRTGLKKMLRSARRPEDKKRVLNNFKDREMFRIDMQHLFETDGDLITFSRSLTDLADVVLGQAYEICHKHLTQRHGPPLLEDGRPCPFSIFGLGKYGGREMGYASDIELLFAFGGPGRTRGKEPIDNRLYFERLCQKILGLIEARQEGIFHIDLRLRPYGNAGSLANPAEYLESYYSDAGEAAPFERQALTKLRWVAGDELLGRRLEAHRDRFVYSGRPWDLKTALHLRCRQMKELVQAGTVNVKYSAGGIIDTEYAVQYLQILNGKKHPALRTPSTLEALQALLDERFISSQKHRDLSRAYLFLRRLVDSLRIVRGNARDLVLPDTASQEFQFLARRLGYEAKDWGKAAGQLERDIRSHMKKTHSFFTSRFRKSGAD